MNIKPINEQVSVADAIYPEDLQQVQALGFKSLICNRVPGEADDHSSCHGLQETASALGLVFNEIPVARNDYPEEAIARFEQALAELPQPVLVFCRSGYRATCLWALSQVNQKQADVDKVMAAASAIGHDLADIKTQLINYTKA